jgi:hypothetical protein
MELEITYSNNNFKAMIKILITTLMRVLPTTCTPTYMKALHKRLKL